MEHFWFLLFKELLYGRSCGISSVSCLLCHLPTFSLFLYTLNVQNEFAQKRPH